MRLQISSGCLRGQSGAGKIDRNGIATLQTEKTQRCEAKARWSARKPQCGGSWCTAENHNAEKHGLFRKYLPEETFSIIAEMPVNPLDVLWDQIQIAYAAIIRAQQIMYVRDQTDKTREMVSNSVNGESWKTQQAWDKQADFLKSQARAQSELRCMIKQYDEMLHKNWELATDEQKARIEQIRSQTAVQDEKRNRSSDAAAAIVENMQTLAEILKSPQPNRNIEDYEDE